VSFLDLIFYHVQFFFCFNGYWDPIDHSFMSYFRVQIQYKARWQTVKRFVPHSHYPDYGSKIGPSQPCFAHQEDETGRACSRSRFLPQLRPYNLILHQNTQIFCMQVSCGAATASSCTHTGNQYVFSPEKGFVPVAKPVMSKEEHLRDRLCKRLTTSQRNALKTSQSWTNNPKELNLMSSSTR